MFTPEERDQVRDRIIAMAQSDRRVTAGALIGSTAAGLGDRWSDIDLAFGVRSGNTVQEVLETFSALMYRDSKVIHHLDVPSGPWIYRVFLLENTLQVDLAFAPDQAHAAPAAPGNGFQRNA